jgi:recombination protein RecA
MSKEETVKKLNEYIVSSGLKKSEVEDAIGFPKNGLSNILSGKKELSDKWQPKFEKFISDSLSNETNGTPSETSLAEAKSEEPKKIEPRTELVVDATGLKEKPSAEVSKELRLTMDKINKDFGLGSIMMMGDAPIKVGDVVSTGSLSIDNALGIGGLPRGRFVEIYGPESSGKTTITLHIITEAQKSGLRCAFIDAEHAFDPAYAANVGVNVDELLLSQPDYGEQALEIADRLVMSGLVNVIVIDSVAALVPKSELEGEMGDSKMGLHARLMSQACRKLTGIASKTNTLIIFINQIRMKIGMVMGNPEVVPGGQALKFYSSVRMDVRKIAQLKDGDEMIGNRTKVKIIKNKCAPPFKVAEFDIIYGKGISRYGEIVDMASSMGIIKKSGSWYSYMDTKLGQGAESVKALLADNPAMCKEIEAKIAADYIAPIDLPNEPEN